MVTYQERIYNSNFKQLCAGAPIKEDAQNGSDRPGRWSEKVLQDKN